MMSRIKSREICANCFGKGCKKCSWEGFFMVDETEIMSLSLPTLTERLQRARREIEDEYTRLGCGYTEQMWNDHCYDNIFKQKVFTCMICSHTNTRKSKIQAHLLKKHKFTPLNP